MKRAAIITGLFLTATAHASLFPAQSDYYYRLGGDSDVYVPPVTRDEVVSIGGNLNTGVGPNCMLFNPVVSITSGFNDMKDMVAGVPNAVIDNLKGSVGACPLYKLQQSMPGLYNILMNTSLSAQNEFTLHKADCRAIKQSLEDGNSPMASMLTVSDSQGWIDAVNRVRKGEAVDINKQAKVIAQKGDEYGIPWVHRSQGNSGGKKQKPINVVKDVVIAGYNLLLSPSRALDNLNTPDTAQAGQAAFVRYWPKPENAASWAVMVLGDIHISAKQEESAREARAGVGLSTLLKSCPKSASSTTCSSNVASWIWKMVDGKIPSDEANLRRLSAANILITDEIISAIQRMSREEQVMTISRLSEEIAIQNLLEEAMMLRRLLQAGFQIQEVQNLKPVQNMVQYAIGKLDKDILSMEFESRVRKEMMTKTLGMVMDKRTQELAASIPGQDKPKTFVHNGAIYREGEKKQ